METQPKLPPLEGVGHERRRSSTGLTNLSESHVPVIPCPAGLFVLHYVEVVLCSLYRSVHKYRALTSVRGTSRRRGPWFPRGHCISSSSISTRHNAVSESGCMFIIMIRKRPTSQTCRHQVLRDELANRLVIEKEKKKKKHALSIYACTKHSSRCFLRGWWVALSSAEQHLQYAKCLCSNYTYPYSCLCSLRHFACSYTL